MSTPFQYRELPDGHIRLLKIRQPDITQPGSLYLELYTFDPDTTPAYKALSYVWGQPSTEDRYRLKCHDMAADEASVLPNQADAGWMQLTPNLHEALPYVLELWDGYIWIDAICVNQREEAEKSRIVAQMHRFFSEADEVLIWFGPAGDGSDRVMQLLKDIYSHVEPYGDFDVGSHGKDRHLLESDVAERTAGKIDKIEHGCDSSLSSIAFFHRLWRLEHITGKEDRLPRDNDRIWSDFRAFCNRDWLHRVWTYQEAVLAQRATMLCGRSKIPYTAFELIASEWITSPSLIWMGTSFLDPDSPLSSELKSLEAHLFATKWILRSTSARQVNPERETIRKRFAWYSFWTELDAMRSRVCTLDEDRIYGVLALAHERIRSDIPVHYSRDPHAASDLYIFVNNLHLQDDETNIGHALHRAAGQSARRGMPSWCTDWRQPQILYPLLSQLSQMSDVRKVLGPLASRIHRVDDHHNPRLLRIRGYEICRVRSRFSQWDDCRRLVRWLQRVGPGVGPSNAVELSNFCCATLFELLRNTSDSLLEDWSMRLAEADGVLLQKFDFPPGVIDRLSPYVLLDLSDGSLGVALDSCQVGDIAALFCEGDHAFLLRPEPGIDEYGNPYMSYVGMLGHKHLLGADWITEVNEQLETLQEDDHAELLAAVESRLRIFSIK